jgi:hypothetical protein
MAGVKLKSSKPRGWKPLWISTLLLTTVSGAIGYLLLFGVKSLSKLSEVLLKIDNETVMFKTILGFFHLSGLFWQ